MTAARKLYVLQYSEDNDFDDCGDHAVLGIFTSPEFAMERADSEWPNLVWVKRRKPTRKADDSGWDYQNMVDIEDQFEAYIVQKGNRWASKFQRGADLSVFPLTVDQFDTSDL